MEAFGSLMDCHHERIYRLAYRMSGCHDEAEIVTQDTFIQAYRSLQRFDGRSRLITWLHAIAVRKAFDAQRRRMGEMRALPMSEQTDAQADVRRSCSYEPGEMLHQKEMAALLDDAILKLPVEQRRRAGPGCERRRLLPGGRARAELFGGNGGLARVECPPSLAEMLADYLAP